MTACRSAAVWKDDASRVLTSPSRHFVQSSVLCNIDDTIKVTNFYLTNEYNFSMFFTPYFRGVHCSVYYEMLKRIYFPVGR